jgi:hypothetical protein
MNQEIDVSGASDAGDHRSRLLSDGAAGVGICEVLVVCAVRSESLGRSSIAGPHAASGSLNGNG